VTHAGAARLGSASTTMLALLGSTGFCCSSVELMAQSGAALTGTMVIDLRTWLTMESGEPPSQVSVPLLDE
jgi:hypothetical protein